MFAIIIKTKALEALVERVARVAGDALQYQPAEATPPELCVFEGLMDRLVEKFEAVVGVGSRMNLLRCYFYQLAQACLLSLE